MTKDLACDLHTHSTFSDGTDNPEELVRKAKELGLGAVALTDHNTVAGLRSFCAAGKKYGIETIPGIEISCTFDKDELHIVGLFLSETAKASIDKEMSIQRIEKANSNLDLFDALNKAGYEISFDDLKRRSEGVFNRAHVAEVLAEKGYVKSKEEAFATLLSEEYGYYKPPKRITAEKAIGLLRSSGAVPVWAHPLFDGKDHREAAVVERYLPKLCEWGLMAMEIRYSEYDEATTAAAKELAERFRLAPSGGSDYHGRRKQGIALGTGRGGLFVPYAWKETLESLARQGT